MLFVTLSPGQVAAYSYACIKLQNTLNKMSKARKALEDLALSSFNKSFAKCVHLFTLESLQFENEIHAQIECFNCLQLSDNAEKNIDSNEDDIDKADVFFSIKSMELICNYLEENYIKSYRLLLKDKYLNSSLKSLINNQLQVLLSSVTQLRLLNEVEPAMN